MSLPIGFKHSDATLEKMSKFHRANPVRHWLGKKMSQGTKAKISFSNSGEKNHFYGKKHSQEALAKMRKPHKKMTETTLLLLKGRGAGRVFSTAHRKKLSDTHLRNREKHPMWKGGITPLVRVIRKCIETRLWRESVFKRDNYTCQMCYARGGILHADHMKAFSVIFAENKITSYEIARNCKELWDINNGRTLCKPCHKKTPTWGRNLSRDAVII